MLNENVGMKSQVRQLSILKDRALVTIHWGQDDDHKYGVELVDLGTNKTLAQIEGYNSALF